MPDVNREEAAYGVANQNFVGPGAIMRVHVGYKLAAYELQKSIRSPIFRMEAELSFYLRGGSKISRALRIRNSDDQHRRNAIAVCQKPNNSYCLNKILISVEEIEDG